MTSVNSSSVTTSVELAPNYKIPLVLVGLSLPILLIQPWIGGIFSLFGLFLMFQTVAIRLQFTETALDVYRSGQLIRQFPYQDWQNWEIFWSKVPILFYFKEVKSIHFLPIIFDAKMLRTCLEKYCSKE
ncbi:DUF3119 domain-containing protein [Aphanothece hegewaldii CCALA 016]|uniref:DUF3119 domain-containing protein n=1 Tax=Aphanothece hegewaldii CCALA 016 TaxID=2107694 RepID=A0A2T1LUE8_9CHRO|nr:DUF3119 family protein [Aphanothece hegewaldii]PSF35166.1 DUF3119 domain-containing protein [Aphanothece hegewaldii CCALA 016]